MRDNLKRIIQSLARFYPGGEACGGLLACEYVNESFLFSFSSLFSFYPFSFESIFSGNGRISTGGLFLLDYRENCLNVLNGFQGKV